MGKIPNRGLFGQPDIDLTGVPYLQTVQDVTLPATGRGDNPKPTCIHFEPGVWLRVLKAKFHTKTTANVVRMACISYDTTINAQTLVPTCNTISKSVLGGVVDLPTIGDIDITLFTLWKVNEKKIELSKGHDCHQPENFQISTEPRKIQ